MHFPANATVNRTQLATATAALLAVCLTGSLALEFARIGSLTGLVILLLGTLRLACLHGRRATLLGRFLSPGVSALMERDGLPKDIDRDLSVVCADIRNFTRFTDAAGSACAMQLLREYYDAVGAVVSAHGGTVKDYAGDGILVLVGATDPLADHADRAVTLASAIRDAARQVTGRWSTDELPLGIGVGVASGITTLGMLGGASERMEYGAVGPAVNLAARLCGQAATDEVLVHERTLALSSRGADIEVHAAGRSLTLKGIDATVTGFAL